MIKFPRLFNFENLQNFTIIQNNNDSKNASFENYQIL